MPFLNPQTTLAILLGSHDWVGIGLGLAPSFLRSAQAVAVFLGADRFGIQPHHVINLFDSPAAASDQLSLLLDQVDTEVRRLRNTEYAISDILVYYIGHGFQGEDGHLSLLVKRTRRNIEAETGIKAPDLARTLRRAAPQQRRTLVLDCCFSERAAKAFIGMSGLDDQVAASAIKALETNHPERGTLILCSSPSSEVSIGAPDARRTLFTGSLLEVLEEGERGRANTLSFADIRDAAFDRMLISFGAAAPRPALHQTSATHGDLTRVPVFINRAHEPIAADLVKAARLRADGKNDDALDIYDYYLRINVMHISIRYPHMQSTLSHVLMQKYMILWEKGLYALALPVIDKLIYELENYRVPEAFSFCERYVDSEPQLVHALIRKGGLLDYNLGQPDEAVGYYDRIISLYDKSSNKDRIALNAARALNNKALYLARSSRAKNAMLAFEELLVKFGNSKDKSVMTVVALSLKNKGDWLADKKYLSEARLAYKDLYKRFGSTNQPDILEILRQVPV